VLQNCIATDATQVPSSKHKWYRVDVPASETLSCVSSSYSRKHGRSHRGVHKRFSGKVHIVWDLTPCFLVRTQASYQNFSSSQSIKFHLSWSRWQVMPKRRYVSTRTCGITLQKVALFKTRAARTSRLICSRRVTTPRTYDVIQ
jgi:hypothetical protein